MISITKAIVTLITLFFASYAYRLVLNVNNARKTGLPFFIVPWDQTSILWLITGMPLRPWLRKILPEAIFERVDISIFGWEFRQKLGPIEKLASNGKEAKTFMVAGCGKLEFYSHDPEVTTEVLRRPRDFQQLDLTSLVMAKFGHNVFTTNGDQWAKQRKLVASVINERVSKAVFDESVHQTRGMLAEISSKSVKGKSYTDTNQLFVMVKKAVVHVLSGATMGTKLEWEDKKNELPRSGYHLSYIDAVKSIFNNVTGPMLLPRWILSNWPSFLPGQKNMQTLALAMGEFPRMTQEMVNDERAAAKLQETETKQNIMSQLLKASAQSESSNVGLTDDEIIGNLFVFTAAGFDTTANTLSYALVLLARYPTWQDWILEEVDQLLPAETDVQFEYTTLFPKITRMLALMFETLRLYPPLIHVAKMTVTPQVIKTSTQSLHLPANTTVYVNAIGLHLDAAIWRGLNKQELPKKHVNGDMNTDQEDEHVFRPNRWINPPGSSHALFQPPKGTFIPWSGGPRICPGMKMAQVEFTAILMTLLRRHRVEAVPHQGESVDEINARLDKTLQDSISIVTLQMVGIYDIAESQVDSGLKLRISQRDQRS